MSARSLSQTRPERRRRRRRLVYERLDLQAPAVHPPPLDLRIRIIVELRPILLAVRPLVRVPLRLDWLAVELGRHRGAHRRVARALLGPVGKVEDLLVQAGRLLRNRRTRKPSLGIRNSGGTTRGGMVYRRSWYAWRRAGTCFKDERRENRSPRTAASSMAIAAPCAR
jgi:hypothetical protein